MRQINVFLLVVAIFFNGSTHAGEIIVSLNKQTLVFSEPVRLDHVLTAFMPPVYTYWPAAILYQLPATEAELLRSKVLQKITYLAATAGSEKQQAMHQLAQKIEDWQLAKPVLKNLNYDLARIKLSENPMLPNGNYLLLLPPRPETILVFGAITDGVITLPHQSASAIDYYLGSVKRVAANDNQLQLLQADGRLIDITLLAAMSDYVEVQPGGVVFIPFASVLFEPQYAELNELLIQLVQYKVAV